MYEVFGGSDDLRLVRLSRRWTMLLVNSQWLGHDAGRIAPDTLARARRDTREDEAPRDRVHASPARITCDDPYCGIVNAEETLSVLRRHQRVRAVLSGHLHRVFDNPRDGIRFLGAPSTCCQLTHGGVAALRADLGAAGSTALRSSPRRHDHILDGLRRARVHAG